MRLSTFALPVLTAIFACGPGQPAGTDTDPTTGSTSQATASSTTDAPTTSTASPATGPVETTEPVEATTTGEPVPGTTGEPATTTDPSTGGPPDVAFAAQFWFGGLDHLDVRMADFKADLCVSIQFARPGGGPRPGLTLPPDWWYQGAAISQGAADCLDFTASFPDIVAADSVAGEGDWDTAEFCPKSLDLDLVLTFPQGQPQVPAEVTVAAAAIPVQGC